MSIKHGAAVALCLLLCTLPPAAQALKSDAAQPVKISADRWDHKGAANGDRGTSVYSGHVIITQGSIRITADKATLTLNNGKLDKALIVGNPATFYQSQENAQPIRGHAQKIDYDARANTIELIDHARAREGDKLITANYIRYNTAQQRVVAHRAKQEKGRVHVVIPPRDHDQSQ